MFFSSGKVINRGRTLLANFQSFVYGIVSTVKVNPQEQLEYTNSLRKYLQFTADRPDVYGILVFLDLNMKVNDARSIRFHSITA